MFRSPFISCARHAALIFSLGTVANGCAGKAALAAGAGGSAAQGGSPGAGAGGLGGATQANGGATSGQLRWYATCGFPLCRTPSPDASAPDAGPPCPALGSACSDAGVTCGTPSDFNCGVVQVCATQSPTAAPGGCPISSKQYKNGIEYLGNADLQRLHDAALRIKLATYQYKSQVADPNQTHLGFIIEDNPNNPAVDRPHNRVNMYGFVSMVVAGMQVQEKEIVSLRQELKAVRREAASCRSASK